MKHLLIITQYYPLAQRPNIPMDNRVVRELCSEIGEDERITVLLCHAYRRVDALKRFLPLLMERQDWHRRMVRDENGVDVLLCEHPCVLPRVSRIYPWFGKKYVQMLEAYMREKGIEDFDAVAVHFPTRHAGLAKRVRARRRVAVVHAFDVKSGWRRLCLQRTLAPFDAVLCRAPWIAQSVPSCVKEQKTELCLSGLPLWMLQKDRRERKAWKQNGVLHLLFAGKLNANKNVDAILNALHALRTKDVLVCLTVIGQGEREAALKKRVDKLGLRGMVTFAGRLPREEVYARMEQADAFVMVSKSETLGLVYLEAMAAGAIVVASKGRGVDGLVQDGVSGFLVSPDDDKALTQTLLRLSQMSSDEAQTMRAQAFSLVKEMDEKSMSRHYLQQICAAGQEKER